MKATAYREMSDNELKDQVKELKAELFNLRFQQATGQLNNPVILRDTRRNIARVMTILSERKIKAQA